MSLPTNTELSPFRLKSLEATNIDQTAVYGIQIDGPTVKFTINNAPFDHDTARKLELGKVEVWSLRSVNQVAFPAGITHPFHIHVNPFEVFSIKNRDGKEMLTEPVWRDTIALPEGWRVLMRTQYKDFLGMFVQHCHILDHEDQGMMELLEVVPPKATPTPCETARQTNAIRVARPYAAPDWKLPDASGRVRDLKEFAGRPTVLFFFEGYQCLPCTRQLSAFEQVADAFAESGINLVGVSSRKLPEAVATEWRKRPGITLVGDPDQIAFRRYACYAGGPLHGVFILDANGLVQWQALGVKPVLEMQDILAEARKLKSLTESWPKLSIVNANVLTSRPLTNTTSNVSQSKILLEQPVIKP
jgi:peroxiredoxin